MNDTVMSAEDVLETFRSVDAILEGHFILSSGLHSPVFLQKALVYRSPQKTERLCASLAAKIKTADLGPIDCIVAPAMGAVIPGFETAKQLGLPYMWVERENGEFAFRRGFALRPGERVVLVEDIITTGLSVNEAAACVREAGGVVVACACLIDRSGGKSDLDIPLISLATYAVPAYAPDALPPDLAALPAVKPGSRGLS